jgi:predicted nucleic acid-binding protein
MTDTDLLLVDSSGWLEFITDDEKADAFAPYIEAEQSILVPTIVIYEVTKRLVAEFGKHGADRFLSFALRQRVVGLDEQTAIAAAEFSLRHHLHMADAIIYATAQQHAAELVTSDPHFKGLPGVTLV